MSYLPLLNGEEMVKVLERFGFRRFRQRGSHLIMIKDDARHQPVVPMHARSLKKGLIRAIIRQAGLTVDEFRQKV